MIELGKIQAEDEAVVRAVIAMTLPKRCVEFGYLNGHSTRVILGAMPPDSTLVSYDNSVDGRIDDPRFTFKRKSQTEYEEDSADFVFFDASHDLELNMETMDRVIPTLSEGAIVLVHDTGLWRDMLMDTGGHWIGNGYAHRPGEREFANWCVSERGFHAIHLHTLSENRHGMTILQRNRALVL